MQYFLMHAVPDPDRELPPEQAGSAGAYVSCWIDFKDPDGAETLARYYVEQAGWIPEELDPDECGCPERSDYSPGDEGLGYFDEALETGACIVFHVYPSEGADQTT